jgi:hypothetical protein
MVVFRTMPAIEESMHSLHLAREDALGQSLGMFVAQRLARRTLLE